MDELQLGKLELGKVLAGIEQQQNLPASALSVQSTVEMSGNHDRAVHELSRTVLDDPVLTERVLRAANSASHGISGGVRTVTQAVLVLGYDTIRTIALSLIILEHIDSPRQRELLGHELAHAVAAACVARELAAESGHAPEPSAILALMRSMGRIVVAAWAPDGYQAVRLRARREAISESQAARRLLGRAFHTIAQSAALAWGFDQSFAALIGREIDDSKGHVLVAALASQIVEAGTQHGSMRSARVQSLIETAAGRLAMPSARMQTALQTAHERVVQLCEVMGLQDPLAGESQDALDRIALDTDATAEADGIAASHERDAVGRPLNYRDLLVAGLAGLSEAALRADPLEQLVDYALDTMHRAMGFQRSMFVLRDPAASSYRPRAARGANADAIRRSWTLATGERNLFTAAVERDVSLNIADASTEKVRTGLPSGFARSFPDAASFVLLPMRNGSVPVGFFYGDRSMCDPLTGAADIRLLSALKNQLLLAIRSLG